MHLTNKIIKNIMTPQPHTIGKDISLKKAFQMMKEHHIRHLPVLERGQLVGLISDRDLRFSDHLSDLDQLTVEDIMSQDPIAVTPNTDLSIVLEQMIEKKAGSVIVVENGTAKGIFTSIDALKLLKEKF